MSDTPRTNAAVVSAEYIRREMDYYTHKFVLADVARELERELAQAREAESKMFGLRIAAELRADRARDDALAVLRRELQLDENGDDTSGVKPSMGWETGYCAGIRTAYKVLKNNAAQAATNAAGQELPACGSAELPFESQRTQLGLDAAKDSSAKQPAPAAPEADAQVVAVPASTASPAASGRSGPVEPASSALVRKAMLKAWHLGQTYWQQADHNFHSEHRKADDTRAKFNALLEATCAMLAAAPASGPSEEAVKVAKAANDDEFEASKRRGRRGSNASSRNPALARREAMTRWLCPFCGHWNERKDHCVMCWRLRGKP